MCGSARRTRVALPTLRVVSAIHVTRSVLLAAPASEVWATVSTLEGINAELMPLVRMTFPARARNFTASNVPLGETVCWSWLLAGGVVPFDRHAFCLESVTVDPAAGLYGFKEESMSWLQERWSHRRTIVPLDDGSCRLTDRLVVLPRLALFRPFARRIIPAVFDHRHRRLVERWGTAGIV